MSDLVSTATVLFVPPSSGADADVATATVCFLAGDFKRLASDKRLYIYIIKTTFAHFNHPGR